MGGSSFDLIAQELLRQKQVMDQMEDENRELRHQLTDLREGRGIFVDIAGRRFSLFSEYTTPSEMTNTEAEPTTEVEPTVAEQEPQPQPEPMVAQHDVAQDETEELVMSIPETPRITVDFYEDEEGAAEEQMTGPTFLEEVMIDEFASAATSPLSVWSDPKEVQEKKPEADEELAALRRQLIGSYLLE